MSQWFSKPMDAYYTVDCESCGELVLEDETFYFTKNEKGESIKVCEKCKDNWEEPND